MGEKLKKRKSAKRNERRRESKSKRQRRGKQQKGSGKLKKGPESVRKSKLALHRRRGECKRHELMTEKRRQM